MTSASDRATIGVLSSGGLDSCILLAHLLQQGHGVRPFYVRSGLFWQCEELSALQAFLERLAAPRLQELLMRRSDPLRKLEGKCHVQCLTRN